MDTVVITGLITVAVTIVGIFGNWYLVIRNKKKEIEQQEYQFLLENLKDFWERQNSLYTETLKVVSELVFNNDTGSEDFLNAYNRFWELYWGELPTCESQEIATAMVGLKDLVHEKKHLEKEEILKREDLKKSLENGLLQLSKAVRNSSLLLEYSEKIKAKIKSS